MDKRSYTRLLAVQAFYSITFINEDLTSGEMLEIVLALQKSDDAEKSQKPYDEALFDFLFNRLKREKTIIDSSIAQHIDKDWSLERMDSMVISIIRAATCELLYLLDIAVNIIINEYVNIASLFLKKDETNFVNAILCNIAKSSRVEELKIIPTGVVIEGPTA